MAKINFSLINNVRNEANNSVMSYKMAAAVIRGSKLLTRPVCNTKSNSYRGFCGGSLHAEARAILNYFDNSLSYDRKRGWCLNKHLRNLNIDILVMRINKLGDTNARPCYHCLDMMKALNIKRVYYSTGPNEIVCENVKDMVSIQTSGISLQYEKHRNPSSHNNKTFYEDLLIKTFPSVIKQTNLDKFIIYNMRDFLPCYQILIINQTLIFLNSLKQQVLTSTISS